MCAATVVLGEQGWAVYNLSANGLPWRTRRGLQTWMGSLWMGIPEADDQANHTADGLEPMLSVIIPAYNEESGIAAILDRVLGIQPGLASLGIAGPEVIVVDDGSRDQTRTIVRRYPNVRLICHEQNRGYGGALKTGFFNATGSWLAFLDADGTYPPEHFPELCRAPRARCRARAVWVI